MSWTRSNSENSSYWCQVYACDFYFNCINVKIFLSQWQISSNHIPSSSNLLKITAGSPVPPITNCYPGCFLPYLKHLPHLLSTHQILFIFQGFGTEKSVDSSRNCPTEYFSQLMNVRYIPNKHYDTKISLKFSYCPTLWAVVLRICLGKIPCTLSNTKDGWFQFQYQLSNEAPSKINNLLHHWLIYWKWVQNEI